MAIKYPKSLILKLIMDDLINTKLVTGLCSMGLEAEKYHLHLSDTILKLMGFVRDSDFNDKVFEGYVELAKKSVNIDITHNNATFEVLAKEIYSYLASSRRPRKANKVSNNLKK